MSNDRIVAMKALENQYRNLEKDPTGYFKFEVKDEDIFEWYIYMNGTVDTPHEGAIYKLSLKWPEQYPYSPPILSVLSDFWHPNVYEDGKVCISILHPPGDDPMSGERPEERWLPIHTAETIMLSFMSMLADPNCSSPANIDAGVQYRKDRKTYNERVKNLAGKAKKENGNIIIPPKKKRFVEPKFDDFDNYDDGTMVYEIASDSDDLLDEEEEEGEINFSDDDEDDDVDDDDDDDVMDDEDDDNLVDED